MLSFQKLDVYQRSIEFLVFARRLLVRIPKGHGDLVDQLRRSAQSIPQNVAEGAGKTTRADKAYSSHDFRALLDTMACQPVIPSSTSWIDPPPYDKDLYKARAEVECTLD